MITAFSQRFLDYIALASPELHAKLHPAKDRSGNLTGFLLAEIQAPNPKIDHPLWITTEDDEITIGFDAYHEHFGSWDTEQNEEEYFRAALERVAQIKEDQVTVLSWWHGGKWAGSMLAVRGEVHAMPKYVADGATSKTRSWTGKYDNEKPA